MIKSTSTKLETVVELDTQYISNLNTLNAKVYRINTQSIEPIVTKN